jgi:hypothetical protein
MSIEVLTVPSCSNIPVLLLSFWLTAGVCYAHTHMIYSSTNEFHLNNPLFSQLSLF